jgi:hypothetical protein
MMHDQFINEIKQTELYNHLHDLYVDSPTNFIKEVHTKMNEIILASAFIIESEHETGLNALKVFRSLPVTFEFYTQVIGEDADTAYVDILKKLKRENDFNN